MSDFNSWEEVYAWLDNEEEDYPQVECGAWVFSRSYMSCGECCEEDYATIEDAMESLQWHAGREGFKRVRKI